MVNFNVVIADDHPIVLVGVRELVERNKRFCIVGEAVCSVTLIKLLELQPVDLVITDFNMPGDSPYGDGLKLMGYLARHFPTVRILVLTMISNPLILTRLHELGVMGVIQKNHLHTEIQAALVAFARGNKFKNAEPQPVSLSGSVNLDERFKLLSAKEYEILRLFVSGRKSVNEIARGLNRSTKTISTQKTSAMRKLGVRSEQDLLAYCLESKIFQ